MSYLFFAICLLIGASSVNAAEKVEESACSRYLFAYFEGRGDQQEHLRFAISRDAVNWRALNRNNPIVNSSKISQTGGIRDPHILRGEQGEFLIVATDMNTVRDGWGSNPGIVLMRSWDLVKWEHHYIDLPSAWPAFKDAFWVWAPQVIYDKKVGKYMIYFTLQRTGDGRSTLITYYAYANDDFSAFESEPKVLFSAKYGSIDNDIIERNGKYYLFYKGNTKDGNGREIQNGIQMATASKLLGPYTENFRYIDAYANNSTVVEGSSTFKLIGEEKYILMYDLYSAGRYEYQTSTDLRTWTQKPQSFTKDFYPRHGSVIPITLEETERLAKAFPSPDLDSIYVDGWVEPEDTGGQLLVTYSFENGLTDDGGTYSAALKGGAEMAMLADGNHVLRIGGADGYLDLGTRMGKAVLAKMRGNYTISMDICVAAAGNTLSSYCWAWAFANGTDRYVGMVNAAGNGNWYHEIKNGSAEQAFSYAGITTGQWHTLTVVCRGTTTSFYIDGGRRGYGQTTIHPSAIASALTQCWLGRSPFSADAYMRNTMMDNLRLYNKALTAAQVGELYAQSPTTTQLATTGIEGVINPSEGNGEWTMDNGQWRMENGQWTMDNGQWRMENGKWTMDNGQSSSFNPQSSIFYDLAGRRISSATPGVRIGNGHKQLPRVR